MENNFLHVSGTKSVFYESDQWITWVSEEDPYNSLSRQNMPFKQDKFIIIPKPGFYYIYTQVTYADNIAPTSGAFRVGHEVIRQSHCGHGAEETLLTSWITQRRNQTVDDNAFDSTHMGGTFYLSTNDRVGVRMKKDSAMMSKLASNPPSLCNFGAFTVMPDTSERIDNTCCCLDA
ncbi:CD40 ligand-like [Amphiura filiformis]|uniref:CD40 ligand-like n=1 Tax=Amphiura filiformis TaxID=82378 RepID=UPI003B21189F